MRFVSTILLAAGLLTAGNLFADDTTNAPLRKAAIIVENHAGKQFNDKVAVLEDLLGSRIAGKGYSVISRDAVTRALKDYSTGVDPNNQATATDALLESGISALRLAQNLGADFILIPAITTYGTERAVFTGDGVETFNVTHTLRVNYKIAEAGTGGAIKGGVVTATKTIRQSAGLQVDDNDIINELLDDAAGQLAEAITQNADSLPVTVAKNKMVGFNIACSMTDPRQQPILISAVGLSADNTVIATNPPIAVQPMDVTVELDGLAIGSAPGAFQAQPGLHKLRLSREGFDTWERTVNIYDGQTLRVALQMGAEGYARWADATAFLATLDNNRKLTDAEAEKIKGIGKFFSESHYRVDTKENFKINNSIF